MVTVVLYYYACGAELYGYCGSVLLYVWCRNYMVTVVLYYYTCGVKLYGYCGTVLLYVWCRNIWFMWFCITICGV